MPPETEIDPGSVGYTDADVELVAHALTWNYSGCDHNGTRYTECDEHRAHAGLGALAAAGRLLPPETSTTVEREIEWRPIGRKRGGIETVTYVDYDEATLARQIDGAHKLDLRMESHRVRTIRVFDDGATLVGPWVPVPPPAEEVQCERCNRPFDPTDPSWTGRSRYRDTDFCRSCVDRCHESTDFMHTCAICAEPPAVPEEGEDRGQ